jgi:TolB-like protein
LSFVDELKRRNVFRTAGLYVAGAWLILQVAGTVLPMVDAPAWLSRGIVAALAIGFIPALVFAWAFELTPTGLKREAEVDRAESVSPSTGRKLDHIIMVVLALALGYFAFDKFVLSPQREAALRQQKTDEVDAARQAGRSEALVESYGDRSIAVLPFVNMSADKEQQYFADGISEELLNLLAKTPQLRVISRSSAFAFKGQNLGIRAIAQRLNVAHVLEGSVRKAGNKVRITAQLIDARSDTHVWSETYDRPLDDIFAVQDEIATAVVAQLKLQLLGTSPRVRATDPRAYALYLQARHLGLQRTPGGYERSIELYQQALAIDANYAAAWTGLADDYRGQADTGLRPIDEGYRLARDAVGRALAIDPDFAPAHAALGWIEMNHRGDLAASARHLGHALALEPTDTDIIASAGLLAQGLGRLDTAIELGEYVTTRDPVNTFGHANLGVAYLYAGRLDDAIDSLRMALSLSPGFAAAQFAIGEALLLKGDPAGALAAIQQETDEGWRTIGMPLAWHALGKQAESDAALAELIQKGEGSWAYNIACVLAFRGETDRAFEWLNRAVAHRDPGLADVAVEPLLSILHPDPRWLPFLRGIERAPEQLAAIRFDVTVPE